MELGLEVELLLSFADDPNLLNILLILRGGIDIYTSLIPHTG